MIVKIFCLLFFHFLFYPTIYSKAKFKGSKKYISKKFVDRAKVPAFLRYRKLGKSFYQKSTEGQAGTKSSVIEEEKVSKHSDKRMERTPENFGRLFKEIKDLDPNNYNDAKKILNSLANAAGTNIEASTKEKFKSAAKYFHPDKNEEVLKKSSTIIFRKLKESKERIDVVESARNIHSEKPKNFAKENKEELEKFKTRQLLDLLKEAGEIKANEKLDDLTKKRKLDVVLLKQRVIESVGEEQFKDEVDEFVRNLSLEEVESVIKDIEKIIPSQFKESQEILKNHLTKKREFYDQLSNKIKRFEGIKDLRAKDLKAKKEILKITDEKKFKRLVDDYIKNISEVDAKIDFEMKFFKFLPKNREEYINSKLIEKFQEESVEGKGVPSKKKRVTVGFGLAGLGVGGAALGAASFAGTPLAVGQTAGVLSALPVAIASKELEDQEVPDESEYFGETEGELSSDLQDGEFVWQEPDGEVKEDLQGDEGDFYIPDQPDEKGEDNTSQDKEYLEEDSQTKLKQENTKMKSLQGPEDEECVDI